MILLDPGDEFVYLLSQRLPVVHKHPDSCTDFPIGKSCDSTVEAVTHREAVELLNQSLYILKGGVDLLNRAVLNSDGIADYYTVLLFAKHLLNGFSEVCQVIIV